jgi:hypothetical protein
VVNALSSASVPVVVVEDTGQRRRSSVTDELVTARMMNPPSGMMEAADDEVTKLNPSPFDEGKFAAFDEDGKATERIDSAELHRAAQAWKKPAAGKQGAKDDAPFGEEGDEEATIVLDSGAIEEVVIPEKPRRR